jgi:hypothetical protein
VTVDADPRILDCVPLRLADWRQADDGRVVAERPRPTSRGLRGAWDRLRWLMSHPRIRLDDLGSDVWSRMNGADTLREISRAAAGAFPDRDNRMDERVSLFATALQHQGLIELRIETDRYDGRAEERSG